MDKIITPNFGSSGGGGKPPEGTLSELHFKLSQAQDTIDHLSRALMAKSEEMGKLLEFLKQYDDELTTLLTGHVEQAQNAKRAAQRLEQIRQQLLGK